MLQLDKAFANKCDHARLSQLAKQVLIFYIIFSEIQNLLLQLIITYRELTWTLSSAILKTSHKAIKWKPAKLSRNVDSTLMQ